MNTPVRSYPVQCTEHHFFFFEIIWAWRSIDSISGTARTKQKGIKPISSFGPNKLLSFTDWAGLVRIAVRPAHKQTGHGSRAIIRNPLRSRLRRRVSLAANKLRVPVHTRSPSHSLRQKTLDLPPCSRQPPAAASLLTDSRWVSPIVSSRISSTPSPDSS